MGFKKLDTTLNEDQGRQMGEINRMLSELFSAPGAPGADFSDLEVESANATNEATAVTLVNELKANFNTLIARLSGE